MHAHSGFPWNWDVAVGAAPLAGQLAAPIATVSHKERRHASKDFGYEEYGRDTHSAKCNRGLPTRVA
jgi:hypothetical protein